MRPLLKPALRRIWRDESTLQIGTTPERSVVLSGLSAPARSFVESLDGTVEVGAALRRAHAQGLPDAEGRRLLGILHEVVQDSAALVHPSADLSAIERARLAPDLAALSLMPGQTDGGFAAFARRRAAYVLLVGGGRVGASVATLLAAAGVGRVVVADPALVSPADLSPAGLLPAALGKPRGEATAQALADRHLSVATEATPGSHPDVAVVVGRGPETLTLADRLVRSGIPHLFVELQETTGVVGPLVLPGTSACRRCIELTRTDRDPAWPRIVAQLDLQDEGVPACDVGLATLIAAQTAVQICALLDGGHPESSGTSTMLPSSVGGTLETSAPSCLTRRRSWGQHPSCGCRWPGESDSAPRAGTRRPEHNEPMRSR